MADTLIPFKSVHPSYEVDGKKVPSVTQILGVINKPYLMTWSNNLGLQGMKLSEFQKDVFGIGTLTHALIQGHLENVDVDTTGYTQDQIWSASVCFKEFMMWKMEHSVQVLETEASYVHKHRKYGGTIDALMIVDGKRTIVDFKTSNQISSEYWLQLAAYEDLLGENGMMSDQVAILRLPKPNGNGSEDTKPLSYEYVVKPRMDTLYDWTTFTMAHALYERINEGK